MSSHFRHENSTYRMIEQNNQRCDISNNVHSNERKAKIANSSLPILSLFLLITLKITAVSSFNFPLYPHQQHIIIQSSNRISSVFYHNRQQTQQYQLWDVNKINNPPSKGSSSLRTTTCQYMLAPAIASVISGSIAGAVGVGVAFPLDTLKTKSQVLGSRAAATANASGNNEATATVDNMNMFQLINLIWRTEGVKGFFGGVRTMMIGQAMIKAVAFSANTNMLSFLDQYQALSTILSLIIAAGFSGFLSSFLVAPFERIKIMMQSDDKNVYQNNEINCIKDIVTQDNGWIDLFSRGLLATISREIPSYGIYFVVYGLLIENALIINTIGTTFAPLWCGAISGMACWAPVYPIDVVKTLLQNTKGDEGNNSAWNVAYDLYKDGGIGAFFDGITPKMLRAAVNHAVTFFVYDLIMSQLQ